MTSSQATMAQTYQGVLTPNSARMPEAAEPNSPKRPICINEYAGSAVMLRRIVARLRVGNAYVNRNQIGAVVGVQPFGGEGLSGTGPKAGGPHYLYRFCAEQTLTINTTAAGGNVQLLA